MHKGKALFPLHLQSEKGKKSMRTFAAETEDSRDEWMHAFEMTIDGVANGEISQERKKVVPRRASRMSPHPHRRDQEVLRKKASRTLIPQRCVPRRFKFVTLASSAAG